MRLAQPRLAAHQTCARLAAGPVGGAIHIVIVERPAVNLLQRLLLICDRRYFVSLRARPRPIVTSSTVVMSTHGCGMSRGDRLR